MSEDKNQSKKLKVMINNYPRLILFLGVFPLFWRVMEILVVITLLSLFDNINIEKEDKRSNFKNIIYGSIALNFLTLFMMIFFLIK